MLEGYNCKSYTQWIFWDQMSKMFCKLPYLHHLTQAFCVPSPSAPHLPIMTLALYDLHCVGVPLNPLKHKLTWSFQYTRVITANLTQKCIFWDRMSKMFNQCPYCITWTPAFCFPSTLHVWMCVYDQYCIGVPWNPPKPNSYSIDLFLMYI